MKEAVRSQRRQQLRELVYRYGIVTVEIVMIALGVSRKFAERLIAIELKAGFLIGHWFTGGRWKYYAISPKFAAERGLDPESARRPKNFQAFTGLFAPAAFCAHSGGKFKLMLRSELELKTPELAYRAMIGTGPRTPLFKDTTDPQNPRVGLFVVDRHQSRPRRIVQGVNRKMNARIVAWPQLQEKYLKHNLLYARVLVATPAKKAAVERSLKESSVGDKKPPAEIVVSVVPGYLELLIKCGLHR